MQTHNTYISTYTYLMRHRTLRNWLLRDGVAFPEGASGWKLFVVAMEVLRNTGLQMEWFSCIALCIYQLQCFVLSSLPGARVMLQATALHWHSTINHLADTSRTLMLCEDPDVKIWQLISKCIFILCCLRLARCLGGDYVIDDLSTVFVSFSHEKSQFLIDVRPTLSLRSWR